MSSLELCLFMTKAVEHLVGYLQLYGFSRCTKSFPLEFCIN